MDEDTMNKEQFDLMLHEAVEDKRAMVMMFQDKDGNWRGGHYKNGSDEPVFARQIGPETVLQMLLTHDGK